jgi:hypothetical protein
MSDLVVRPVRFTDNVVEMRRFLEALGLRPRLESEGGGWVDMVAGGGMVALHAAKDAERPAPSGLTALSFECDDVDLLAKRLTAAGVSGVTGYDEAYGRALRCRDPLDDVIVVDERADDLYGYRRHSPDDVSAGLRVMAVRFTDPLGGYGGFLEALGLDRRGEPNEDFVPYTAGDGAHGVVALHRPRDAKPGFASEPAAVDLAFETREPLADVRDRLTQVGFTAELEQESFGPVLRAIDADCQSVEVVEAPATD